MLEYIIKTLKFKKVIKIEVDHRVTVLKLMDDCDKGGRVAKFKLWEYLQTLYPEIKGIDGVEVGTKYSIATVPEILISRVSRSIK